MGILERKAEIDMEGKKTAIYRESVPWNSIIRTILICTREGLRGANSLGVCFNRSTAARRKIANGRPIETHSH